MWTDVFGSAAATVCRAYNGIFGYFPKACLVSAGYPALVAAVAALVVLVVAARMAWRRLQSNDVNRSI